MKTTTNIKTKVKEITNLIDDKKGEDTTVIDVTKLTTLADYFIITTAKTSTQSLAIANHIYSGLKAKNMKYVHIEGKEKDGWTVVDTGDIIVHIMDPEKRNYYKLESFWSNGKLVNPVKKRYEEKQAC